MANNIKQQYFEAVKKLLLKNNKVYSTDELQQIALDAGMSAESWSELHKELQDSLTRGKGFMKYKNWEDALQELKHAEQINPFHLSVLMEMSEAHRQLWLQNSSPLDEELAEQYAKRCLQIQPHHERSLQLISSLKAPQVVSDTQTKPDWWKKWLVLLVGLLVIGNVLLFYFSDVEVDSKTLGSTASEETSTSVISADTNSDEEVDYGNVRVDVRFDNKNKGLKWIMEDSYFRDFGDSFGYTLKMNVLPQGIELKRLRIKVTLFDENRKAVYSQEKQVASDDVYRHNDFIPVVMTLYDKRSPVPNVVSAEISVLDNKMEILSNNYPESTKKAYAWGVKRPDNMNIEIRERLSKMSESYHKKSSYHHLILEVINKGKYPVKELTVGVSWVNHEPRMVQAEETIVVSESSTTKLRPGQRFILDRTFEVKGYTPDMLQSFGLSITELEY